MIRKFDVKERTGFLLVTDSSPVTQEGVRQFCEQIPTLARKLGVQKIVVDQRKTPSSLGVMDRFQYASEFAAHFRGFKVACVQNSPLRDPKKFGETVAKNRGADICICGSLQEAYDWLEVESV